MKKLLLPFILLMYFGAYSQDNIYDKCMPENYSPNSQIEYAPLAAKVGDFTITDSDGVTWNLYDQLDLGKSIIIDLFSTT